MIERYNITSPHFVLHCELNISTSKWTVRGRAEVVLRRKRVRLTIHHSVLDEAHEDSRFEKSYRWYDRIPGNKHGAGTSSLAVAFWLACCVRPDVRRIVSKTRCFEVISDGIRVRLKVDVPVALRLRRVGPGRESNGAKVSRGQRRDRPFNPVRRVTSAFLQAPWRTYVLYKLMFMRSVVPEEPGIRACPVHLLSSTRRLHVRRSITIRRDTGVPVWSGRRNASVRLLFMCVGASPSASTALRNELSSGQEGFGRGLGHRRRISGLVGRGDLSATVSKLMARPYDSVRVSRRSRPKESYGGGRLTVRFRGLT